MLTNHLRDLLYLLMKTTRFNQIIGFITLDIFLGLKDYYSKDNEPLKLSLTLFCSMTFMHYLYYLLQIR